MFEITPQKYRENLEYKLSQLPEAPGVYLHKNERGDIIYVGKAVVLKNRVKSYFQSQYMHTPKVKALVANIADFEYILTSSETEALTLESNLIKNYRPRYNVLLKDDKSFPYVRIDFSARFPRVETVFRMAKGDTAKYFGPYLSRGAVIDSIEAVRDIFPLRMCKKDITKAIARGERPCLNYHIGKCCAPCTGKITDAEYAEYLSQVTQFLSGHTEDVVKQLTVQMLRESEAMQFERAAVTRNRIRSINAISEKQRAIRASEDERDVFAYAQHEGVMVYAFLVRCGKVVEARHFEMEADDETPASVMRGFLMQYYAPGSHVPREILVNVLPEEPQSVEEWLESIRGAKAEIHVPQRGDKKKLVEMAENNAVNTLEKNAQTKRHQWERTGGALAELAKLVGLENPPERMECYDISHIQGVDVVASMVVFENGIKAPKQYRRFKLKNQQNDDYASMKEVLTRRFERFATEREAGKTDGFAAEPSLMVIDGGRGQLDVALEVLKEQNLSFPAAGLAERLEEVFLPNFSEPLIIPTGSPALFLLQRLRDEAHRFAIEYHRSLHKNSQLTSELEKIKGIGPKRRRLLFDKFVSVGAIADADIETLRAIKGMDINSAKAVFEHFNNKEEKSDD